MNWLAVVGVAVVIFLGIVGVGALWGMMVLASRADDEMESYWREREEDPPLGI